ncbi:hypothetical protein N1851_009873 [Merluccius polli]|uniref:Uncharacterized protein n=1 Tax=Merluccius polli TaxID=89951 RepID=A0AA47MZZ4_MERPO|nr:hypothetical protein N1851_009873 [Merluccius polli]
MVRTKVEKTGRGSLVLGSQHSILAPMGRQKSGTDWDRGKDSLLPKLLHIGSKSTLSKINNPTLTIDGTTVSPSSQARNLGVILDPTLTLEPHIRQAINYKILDLTYKALHQLTLTSSPPTNPLGPSDPPQLAFYPQVQPGSFGDRPFSRAAPLPISSLLPSLRQLGSAQEVNWHLSSHQSTLRPVVRAGLEPATLRFPKGVWWRLALAGDDDADVGDCQRVLRLYRRPAAEVDEDALRVGRAVVHVGAAAVRRGLDDLTALDQELLALVQYPGSGTHVNSPDVNERGLAPAPLVAEEELGALEAAMVEVGLQSAVGAVNAGEALGHRLAGRPVDDRKVDDGRLGPAGLGLGQVLLQGGGLVRQAGHHKVVGHAVTLVLDHGWAYLGKGTANPEG